VSPLIAKKESSVYLGAHRELFHHLPIPAIASHPPGAKGSWIFAGTLTGLGRDLSDALA
jgi:hypothetical protein